MFRPPPRSPLFPYTTLFRSFWPKRCGVMLRRVNLMVNDAVPSSRDWLGTTRTNALAWWVTQAAIVVALLAPVPIRTVIWIIARSEEHTSELQSHSDLVCRLL